MCKSVRRPLLTLALSLLMIPFSAPCISATEARVAWDRSTDLSVTGYKLYYGTQSRNYSTAIDVHDTTSYTVSGLSDTQPYYLAVTAYSADSESDFSQELICYTISVAPPSNGTITPGITNVSSGGSSQTYAIAPAPGYLISDVLVDGVSVGAVSQYTFSNLSACHSIEAKFTSAAVEYTIAASASGNGSISPSGAVNVNSGSSQAFTITPAANYKISNVLVDGTSAGPVTSYTFSNVSGNHTIAASFEPVMYAISAGVLGSGSITPSGTVSVISGASQAFTISPAANYKISDVMVDGSSVGSVTGYTFSNVSGNHTIAASFAPATYTISAGVSGNGSITPSGKVNVTSGAVQTFTMTPAANYKISNVMVDGNPVGATSGYSFSNVSQNHTITACFAPQELPIADAGPDQAVKSAATVTLNGTNSTDSTGGISSYAWVQTGGPSVTLSNSSSAICTFRAPTVTSGTALTFKLNVVNRDGFSSSDGCNINVCGTDKPPVAVAGPNQVAAPYTIVTLDGSESADPDDGIASWSWQQTAGPVVNITNANMAQATIVAPVVESPDLTLIFELTVADHYGLKSTDRCIVNVADFAQPPVANAGADKTVYSSDNVELDGSGSLAAGFPIASYRWKQLSGTPVSFSDPAAPKAVFSAPYQPAGSGDLVFDLSITDASGLSSSDSCVVSVQNRTGSDLVGNWVSIAVQNKNKVQGALRISNPGAQTSSAFQTSFYLSSDGKVPSRLIGTSSCQGVAAGQSITLNPTFSLSGAGGQYIMAVIDSGNSVNESNESNNTAAIRLP